MRLDSPPVFVFGAVLALVIAYIVIHLLRTIGRIDELRRRAEKSEEKFKLVFESAGVGISIGAGGMMTDTNAAYQRILGYSGEELAAMHYTEFTHPDDRELDRDEALRVARGELHHYSYEKRVVRKDGETRWLDVTVSLAGDGGFGISCCEDITERKRLEEELRHSQKMEAVGTLAGGIAHDFNNLMTAVLGYADVLRATLPPGDASREAVDVIAESATRAGDLTRQLLAFSRRQVLRLEPTDLAEIVRRFQPILRRVVPENIRLDFDLMQGAVARVDAAQVEQILLNLVVNARDASPSGGTITIGVYRNGSAELTVADDGVGIDEETQHHIFEPFFTTKGKQAGTGLGLATVDGIVGQSGGTIEVESAPGEGTTFRIRLPLDRSAATPMDAQIAFAPATGHGAILLAEDEEAVRRVTTKLLEIAGYDVIATASGEEALAVLEEGVAHVDVLVTDMVMTGMSGRALAAEARRRDPALPVLFISGYPEDLSSDALGDGIDLLTKPFSPTDLADCIERVRAGVVVTA